jgi:adenylate kinase/nucleoside 2-deoxyribosyltransferase
MKKWVCTGISGSGRIEFLEELAAYANANGRHVVVHDVGALIKQECFRNRMPFTDERILDLDQNLLRSLRSAALKEANILILKKPDADLHLIGVHGTFRWKHRIIPGMSYSDLLEIQPDGFLNIVDDVKTIVSINGRNPKWDADTLPSLEETQEWMLEEEFVTEVLADVTERPVYIVARRHTIANLADLFFSNKKRIYLSYPITAVQKDEPALLKRIQGPILHDLEQLFVVFNPLAIKDMSLANQETIEGLPTSVRAITPKAKEIIKARTIERDFQFIDQADGVVVFYLTDRLSPGVLSEILYAHRNQKPVFMAFPGARSPFLEDMATVIESDVDRLMTVLKDWAGEA